jgi:hypothetical protein
MMHIYILRTGKWLLVNFISIKFLQKDLIHLGAKYSPCMRKDPNLEAALAAQRAEERGTGCCVRDDGSGCVQTTEYKCSVSIYMWVFKVGVHM